MSWNNRSNLEFGDTRSLVLLMSSPVGETQVGFTQRLLTFTVCFCVPEAFVRSNNPTTRNNIRFQMKIENVRPEQVQVPVPGCWNEVWCLDKKGSCLLGKWKMEIKCYCGDTLLLRLSQRLLRRRFVNVVDNDWIPLHVSVGWLITPKAWIFTLSTNAPSCYFFLDKKWITLWQLEQRSCFSVQSD
jgi:hypothetical protein